MNARLLVLVNGRQVYQDDYGYVAWQAIPVELDEIRQIEVVKGPNTALFGFNAVSGVINIITYDPLFDTVNTLTARTGTQNLAEGSVVATVHPLEHTGVRVSIGGEMAREFANPFASLVTASPPRRGSVSADAKAQLTPGVEMTLSVSETSSSAMGEWPDAFLWNPYLRTNSVRAGFTADSPIGTLGLNVYRNELFIDSVILGNSVPLRNVVYVIQASDIVKLGADHTLRFGLEYRDNDLVDLGFPFIGGRVGYQVFAASAMWDWQITPALSFTNAVRGDYVTLDRSGPPTFNGFTDANYNGRRIFEPSFNTGLVWQVSGSDTIRLMAARGVGMPSLIDFSNVLGGNPYINPTVVNNYEIDYDRQLPFLNSVLRTALYYQTNRDLTITLDGPQTNPYLAPPSGNIGSADEFGFEIGIKGHSDSGFRWNGSYSLANVTEHVITNQGAIPDAGFDYMKGTPRHVIILGGGYARDKWELDVLARWQSEYRDYFRPNLVLPPQTMLIHDYITVSARAAYKVRESLVLAVSAQQLNAATLRTTAALPVERRVIASVTVHF